MTLVNFLSQFPAVLPTSMAAFSVVHKYLDAHPRSQAAFKTLSTLLGPLNLPGVWEAFVGLCRAVVAAEDAKSQSARPPLQRD